MLGDALTIEGPPRVLDDRVLVRGRREQPLDLYPADDLLLRLPATVGMGVLLGQHRRGFASGLAVHHVAVAGLGAGDQHHVGVPTLDRLDGAGEQRLLQDAELDDVVLACGDPTASVTSRAGSGHAQPPCGTSAQSMRDNSAPAPASAAACSAARIIKPMASSPEPGCDSRWVTAAAPTRTGVRGVVTKTSCLACCRRSLAGHATPADRE